jgi:predicted amidohydrolase
MKGPRVSDLTLAIAQSIGVPGDLAQSVRDHVRLASLAAEHGARLVLFPELSLTGYDRGLTIKDALAGSDPRLRPLQAAADACNSVIVAGAPVVSAEGLHIGALSFAPGTRAAVYSKQYLHDGEEAAFRPGQGGDQLLIASQRVGLAICADITHPEHARAAAQAGATVYAAGCFITREGYAADAALLQGYASEHGMLVLMANYGAPMGIWSSGGRSAAWSESGRLLACAPDAGEALVIVRRSHGQWRAEAIAFS